MKTEVNQSQFIDAFSPERSEQFTYDGKIALYEYLEDLYESIGEEYDLDIIALCCEYTEYENLAELQKSYNDIETMDDLSDHTTVIPVSGDSFIIQAY